MKTEIEIFEHDPEKAYTDRLEFLEMILKDLKRKKNDN